MFGGELPDENLMQREETVPTMLIGSLGVALLLLAFVLNLLERLTEQSPAYLLMNLFGASLAAVYAWSGGAIPFVILEGVWAGVAAWRLVTGLQKKGSPPV